MTHGLLLRDIEYITQALQQFPEVEAALIFGSRAKGNYKPGSDVDIAIKGERITPTTVTRLSDLLNEAYPLPYFFDVVHYETLKNCDLAEHIERVGEIVFTKELSLPAVAPLRYRHYQHLTPRPETGHSQLYLKGRTMTVGQLVYKMRANGLNAEAAAADMDLPLEQILEALAYYETHRELIESEMAEEEMALGAKCLPLVIHCL